MREIPRLRYVWATLAILLAGPFLSPGVRAGPPPDRLKSLTVSVWLEYDRPGARYIFRGELPDGATLPAPLVFAVPAGSGGPSLTASIDPAGEYHYIRPSLREEGDAIVVEYQINWPHFQFEYYDDLLVRQGQNRQLEFVYQVEYAVDQLILEIKEPYAATSLKLTPPADTHSQGEDGLTLHRRHVGPVAPGQEVSWQIEYNKNDARLATEALEIPTPASSTGEAGLGITPPAASSQDRAVLALLAVLGLATLAGLGLSLRPATTGSPTTPAGASDAKPDGEVGHGKRKAKSLPEPPQVRPARYCHQCGATLSRGDTFCRRCGTRRRGA